MDAKNPKLNDSMLQAIIDLMPTESARLRFARMIPTGITPGHMRILRSALDPTSWVFPNTNQAKLSMLELVSSGLMVYDHPGYRITPLGLIVHELYSPAEPASIADSPPVQMHIGRCPRCYESHYGEPCTYHSHQSLSDSGTSVIASQGMPCRECGSYHITRPCPKPKPQS